MSAAPPAPRPRVLIVDDEVALAAFLSSAVAKLGYSVVAYTDPREALEFLDAGDSDFQVLLTDLAMPHLSGLEFSRRVLAIQPGMSVVLMSGYVDSDAAGDLDKIGRCHLLAKPFTLDQLAASLRTALAPAHQN